MNCLVNYCTALQFRASARDVFAAACRPGRRRSVATPTGRTGSAISRRWRRSSRAACRVRAGVVLRPAHAMCLPPPAALAVGVASPRRPAAPAALSAAAGAAPRERRAEGALELCSGQRTRCVCRRQPPWPSA
ncbi:uncharacterized protein LOC112049129 [Bicyclus anynana]|uniref:Uncharacterized protein LOC112049129 n=1 Tax=Bicyclus anynana TaxID=110368 RepID=A0ABM3M5A2_BICAN|nr:uncharacterized protein LOC112049129 [Bicyclus anynana]XP_052746663.1 uncharacterized protein LOC112049129 [Bicyclus anynana]